jgi:hypothetical protein
MREAGDLILARTIWRLPRAYVKEGEVLGILQDLN